MKKIKKKQGKGTGALPAYVIGFTADDPPAPGFLAAWFNQVYGGPLHIHFTSPVGQSLFEAAHTQWRALIKSGRPPDLVESWRGRLQWGHTQVAELLPIQCAGADRRDLVLHVARLARGLTLLTDGTAYDVVTGSYSNPSDWNERRLEYFEIQDHIQVAQREQLEKGNVWFHTRGLGKFGIEEIETYRPLGLPEGPVIETLMEIAGMLIAQGRGPKVGENVTLTDSAKVVRVVKHRTDQTYGQQMNLREVVWD